MQRLSTAYSRWEPYLARPGERESRVAATTGFHQIAQESGPNGMEDLLVAYHEAASKPTP